MQKIILSFSIFFLFNACSFAKKKEIVLETHPNGKNKIVRYIENEPEENSSVLEIHFYEDGQKQMEGNYLNEKREGKWSYWYKDGTLWTTGHYEGGTENGKKIVWHKNAQKYYEGEIINNERTGLWKFWNEKGKLEKEIEY